MLSGHYPKNKLTIVGSGIIGALEAYSAFLAAKGEPLRITIYDKNSLVTQSTSTNIIPSLTPDEILAVVPRGLALLEKLGILFSLPGGIRVDDVPHVNDSEIGNWFKEQAQEYSKDDIGHAARTKALLALGKRSMDLWQRMYDDADDELKQILNESNFQPCRDEKKSESILHDGYRIDLIYKVPNAISRAEGMKKEYEDLGYTRCKILTPAEVKKADPSLADFCDQRSEINADGEVVWKQDAVALFRPGGCLDSAVFLPKFYAYLQKRMGQYLSDDGRMKNCFQIQFEKHVSDVVYDDAKPNLITGLKFFDHSIKQNKHAYAHSNYVFCPGEAVGTLDKLGMDEPAYAGFAGAVLKIEIPLPEDLHEKYKSFNHCMEVHQEGVVLAWQARFRNGQIFICVGGTKAFYADKQPNINEAFCKNRNLLQLNMINDVLPQFMSLALGKDTKGMALTEDDMQTLEQNHIAIRWAGTRAVAYDGFPTLGKVRKKDGTILDNARVTTHLGSGGVSFAPAAVEASRSAENEEKLDGLTEKVLEYSSSFRLA